MAVHGVRRALFAGATAAVLVLCAACSGGGAQSADPKRSSSSTTSSSAKPAAASGSATPTIEQAHTVPSPGPRGPGIVAPADILVVRPDTIDKATIKAIKHLRGVETVTPFSLSQATIEDQALSIAAIDPATYRTFVPLAVDADQAWDRVAGGELALKSRLQGKVPLDANGYLKVGSSDNAPLVHVGAYVTQQPLIDAVVNQTWVNTLGMKPDNALLIRTGAAAPKPVRHEIVKLMGRDTSAQLVDLATRTGIDPTAKQIAVVTGSIGDAVGVYRYTVLGGGHIAPDPAWVREHITTEVVPILGAVTCNKVIFPQLRAALQDVIDRGLANTIHPNEYAGCYYPRFIAGTTTLSNHAFGLALDINAVENQRGTAGNLDPGVVQAFEEWGFTWGGTWHYTDPMHFEMNSIVTPQAESAKKK